MNDNKRKRNLEIASITTSSLVVVFDIVRGIFAGHANTFFQLFSDALLVVIIILILTLIYFIIKSISFTITITNNKTESIKSKADIEYDPFKWNGSEFENEKITDNKKSGSTLLKYVAVIIIVGIASHFFLQDSIKASLFGANMTNFEVNVENFDYNLSAFIDKESKLDKDSLKLILQYALDEKALIEVHFLKNTRQYTSENYISHLETCILLEKKVTIDSIKIENGIVKYLKTTEEFN